MGKIFQIIHISFLEVNKQDIKSLMQHYFQSVNFTLMLTKSLANFSRQIQSVKIITLSRQSF